MSYTVWYSCAIDLFNNRGVGSCFVESSETRMIQMAYNYKENTTINELHVLALLDGLRLCVEQKANYVELKGVCKYASDAIHRLGTWIRKDEIDLKSHSHLWKQIWALITQIDDVKSSYVLSRRADPMLWITSQASIWHFRTVQEKAIRDLKYPVEGTWNYNEPLMKDDFLKINFSKLLTELQFEKRIQARKKELREQEIRTTPVTNVIQFPKIMPPGGL